MADYQNNKTEKKLPRAPIDWYKVAMSAPCPTAQGKWSSLVWGMYGDNIRLTVHTNDPEDKDNNYGKIVSNFGLSTFFSVLTQLDQAIKAKGEFKVCVAGLNWFGPQGRRDTPRVESELWIGKDANGKMFISLTAPNRPKVVFHFAPSRETHQFRHANGDVLNDAEVSTLYARGYYDLLKSLISFDMLSGIIKHQKPDLYEPEKPKWTPNGGAGNRQGGGNGGSGGGGGYGNRRENNDSGGSAAPARSTREATVEPEEDDVPY